MAAQGYQESTRVPGARSFEGGEERRQRRVVDRDRRVASLWAAHGPQRRPHDRQLLVGRYDDLVALRTQAACRLHAVLRGGRRRTPVHCPLNRPRHPLRSVRADEAVAAQRRQLAVDLLGDEVVASTATSPPSRPESGPYGAVDASDTTLREINGVGPIVAGLILAHVGDPARFATPARFCCPLQRHRSHRSVQRPAEAPPAQPASGNRKLNHAMHLIAVTQVRHDTPGRVDYQRKLAEGKRPSKTRSAPSVEAPDQRRRLATTPSRPRKPLTENGSGGLPRNDSHPAWPALHPEDRLFSAPATPEPDTTLRASSPVGAT